MEIDLYIDLRALVSLRVRLRSPIGEPYMCSLFIVRKLLNRSFSIAVKVFQTYIMINT